MLRWIKKSPWIYEVSIGSCNGCEVEVLNILTPKYDIERLGCVFVESPRHADIVLLTGSGSEKGVLRAKRIINQVPEPKKIIAVGNCPSSGNVFRDERIDLDVDLFIPGCPPRPESIINGIKKLVDDL